MRCSFMPVMFRSLWNFRGFGLLFGALDDRRIHADFFVGDGLAPAEQRRRHP